MRLSLIFGMLALGSSRSTCPRDPAVSEVECQMIPMYWSYDGASLDKVLTRFNDHMAACRRDLLAAKVPMRTINYGANERQSIEVWGDASKSTKMLIWFHGGYWIEGNLTLVSSTVAPLVAEGVLVASVGYRLARKGSYTIGDILDDAEAGVKKLLRDYPNIKTITVGGHSAGAQIAYKVAARLLSPRISRLGLWVGAYELSNLTKTSINSVLGLTDSDAAKWTCYADEIKRLDKLKIVIYAADMDTPTLVAISDRFATHLKEKNAYVELKKYPKEDHFSIIERLSDTKYPQTKHFVSLCSKE